MADYRAAKRPVKVVRIVSRLAETEADKARANKDGFVRERALSRPGPAKRTRR